MGEERNLYESTSERRFVRGDDPRSWHHGRGSKEGGIRKACRLDNKKGGGGSMEQGGEDRENGVGENPGL
jgi:hypothetical protein